MLLKHFGTTQAEISEILTGLKYDYAILQNPTSLINANILGVYLEHIVKKTGNTRIGLETGFLLPFVLTGSFFNIYNQSKTVREIFENENPFDRQLITYTHLKRKKTKTISPSKYPWTRSLNSPTRSHHNNGLKCNAAFSFNMPTVLQEGSCIQYAYIPCTRKKGQKTNWRNTWVAPSYSIMTNLFLFSINQSWIYQSSQEIKKCLPFLKII